MHILKKGNSSTKILDDTTLVRSILEYGAGCWDPYREGQIYVGQGAKERGYICVSYERIELGNIVAA